MIENNIKNLVKKQLDSQKCSQLLQKQLKNEQLKLSSIETDNLKQLTKTVYLLINDYFNPKGLKYKSIIDQFNGYVADCRRYNQYAEKEKDLKEQQKIQMKRLKQIIDFDEQIWFRYAFGMNNGAMLLNSSQNIQRYFTGLFLNDLNQGLVLNYHSQIIQIHIDYFKQTIEIDGKRQVIMLFFQMKRHLMNDKSSGQYFKIIELIQNEIYESDEFFQKIIQIDLTPLSIRKSLKSIINKKQVTDILNDYNDYKNNNKNSFQVVEKILKVIENCFQNMLKKASINFVIKEILNQK